MKKNNLKKSILILISYLICFVITRLQLNLWDKNYFISMNIVQGFYFFAVLIITLLIFFCPKSEKIVLISSTIGLILYSACFYCFSKPLFSLFISSSGIINLIEYFSKIYFIALPLLGFSSLKLKKENTKKLSFLLIFKIFFLLITTIIFHYLFQLNGILYAWPFNEFIFLVLLIIINN